jgi:hypothetical protein
VRISRKWAVLGNPARIRDNPTMLSGLRLVLDVMLSDGECKVYDVEEAN